MFEVDFFSYKLNRSLAPLWYCIQGSQQTRDLVHLRNQLQHEVAILVEDLGPQVGRQLLF